VCILFASPLFIPLPFIGLDQAINPTGTGRKSKKQKIKGARKTGTGALMAF